MYWILGAHLIVGLCDNTKDGIFFLSQWMEKSRYHECCSFSRIRLIKGIFENGTIFFFNWIFFGNAFEWWNWETCKYQKWSSQFSLKKFIAKFFNLQYTLYSDSPTFELFYGLIWLHCSTKRWLLSFMSSSRANSCAWMISLDNKRK